MSDDALKMVDQLLSNEQSPKKKNIGGQQKFKKRTVVPVDLDLNKGYDPDAPQEYWPGDTINLTQEMLKKTRLPTDAFMVAVQTPSPFREASVYCPWYSIYGWGANTRDAMEECAQNIADYWKRFPDKAQALLDSYKEEKPKKRSICELKSKAQSVADILEDEKL